ncbi:MAG: hypothetical protein AAFZ35_13660 [Cyanobacteria bacterium J06649_12]
MPDFATFSLFLSAAIVLAITPGPGIFYVMPRSLKGGRVEGVASAMGTSVGGIFHVVAAALGISVDFIVIAMAGPIGQWLKASPRLRTGQRYTTGTGLIALGSYVALTGEGE